MIIYEYVSGGEGVLTSWHLQEPQKKKMRGKLDRLHQVDRNMAVGSILFKLSAAKLYYVKIAGNVALRPIAYVSGEDVTFLVQRWERDKVLLPPGAESVAADRQREVQSDRASVRRRLRPQNRWGFE